MNRSWLQEIRKRKCMTHLDVANNAGIKRQYYGMIENGKSNPSVEVAKKIADILDFEWTLFFESKGNETLPNERNVS